MLKPLFPVGQQGAWLPILFCPTAQDAQARKRGLSMVIIQQNGRRHPEGGLLGVAFCHQLYPVSRPGPTKTNTCGCRQRSVCPAIYT